MSNQICDFCEREANYLCGDCKIAKYCTPEHRKQHWNAVHKEQCKVIKQQRQRQMQESVNKYRFQTRKRYYQHFNHKIYDQCIVVARQLFQLERKHIEQTKQIFNQFQYGVAVCLLCRTYLLVNRQLQAKQQIDQYIRKKLHFLEDLRNIPTLKQIPIYPLKAKSFLQKKLALISAVANIYHSLGINCIKYYQIYTAHIELVFGSQSYQLSNAYFCIGTYYKQINQTTKAIACFVKAANIRGKKGGDCYVNISLLYRKQGRTYAAIDMMLTAIKLNQEQYGSNSREVGEVYQKLGLLYLDIMDFNNAVSNMENALKIYINQKESDDYERIRSKIQIIYGKVKATVDHETQKQKKFQKLKEEENKAMEDMPLKRDDLLYNKAFQLQKIFKVSQSILNRLSPMELFRLSQLQIQMQECRSEFAVAYSVGNSQFFKKLSDNRKRQLKSQNLNLFRLINLQMKAKQQQQQN